MVIVCRLPPNLRAPLSAAGISGKVLGTPPVSVVLAHRPQRYLLHLSVRRSGQGIQHRLGHVLRLQDHLAQLGLGLVGHDFGGHPAGIDALPD